jgi:serine/threonine protein kinase
MPPPKLALPKLQAALQRSGAESVRGVAPGQTFGDYELGAELGKGGHGAVFRAVHRPSGTHVALKVLHAHVASEELKLRMKREAYALSQLSGTCAVTVYECSELPSGQVYLAMELLEGRDLRGVMDGFEARGERVPVEAMLALLEPIASTLHVAHERGIIHRDLKPENIFVKSDGSVRLLDFGLMKDHSLAKLTEVGTIAGSPAYIAPEAWAGLSDRIDHRIDVYSLGVIVFRMLTGVRPFEPGEHLLDFIVLVGKAPRPSLVALRPELPRALDAWTARALSAKREERFGTVRELWAALVAALG